jgi:hypothetical protein
VTQVWVQLPEGLVRLADHVFNLDRLSKAMPIGFRCKVEETVSQKRNFFCSPQKRSSFSEGQFRQSSQLEVKVLKDSSSVESFRNIDAPTGSSLTTKLQLCHVWLS